MDIHNVCKRSKVSGEWNANYVNTEATQTSPRLRTSGICIREPNLGDRLPVNTGCSSSTASSFDKGNKKLMKLMMKHDLHLHVGHHFILHSLTCMPNMPPQSLLFPKIHRLRVSKKTNKWRLLFSERVACASRSEIGNRAAITFAN